MTENTTRYHRLMTGFAAIAALVALPGCETMQGDDMTMAPVAAEMDMEMVRSMVASWPEASRNAAMAMMEKYGMPDGATNHLLMWHNNGPWKWTRVSRDPVQHNFPMPHPDVLEQAIDYDAPVDKYDELARYDGSVMLERTKGLMSARCDKEGANFLAINLANDVATGRKTVDQARSYYARAISAFKQSNRMDPYMQGLRFQPPARAGDPDSAAM